MLLQKKAQVIFDVLKKHISFYFILVSPCRKCGLPLCGDCSRMGMPKYHGAECKLFEDVGKYKSEPVTTYKVAKGIYMYLTPLRFLLEAEKIPELLELNANLEERMDTLIYFLTLSHVIKPIHKALGLGERFSSDLIQVNHIFRTHLLF